MFLPRFRRMHNLKSQPRRSFSRNGGSDFRSQPAFDTLQTAQYIGNHYAAFEQVAAYRHQKLRRIGRRVNRHNAQAVQSFVGEFAKNETQGLGNLLAKLAVLVVVFASSVGRSEVCSRVDSIVFVNFTAQFAQRFALAFVVSHSGLIKKVSRSGSCRHEFASRKKK